MRRANKKKSQLAGDAGEGGRTLQCRHDAAPRTHKFKPRAAPQERIEAMLSTISADLKPVAFSPNADGVYEGRTNYATLGPGTTGTCLLSADETGGALSLFVVTFEPGAGVPPHIHTNEDEGFRVLEGELQVQLGDKHVSIAPGGSAWGPRGVAHGLQNVGSVPARVLVVATPGGFENFFGELNTFRPVPGEAEADMMGRMVALLGKHGMSPAAPAVVSDDIPVLGPENSGELIDLGGHGANLRVTSDQSNGALLWLAAFAEMNNGVPPHIHESEDDVFYVVSGKVAVEVGDTYLEAGPGSVAFLPRNIMHSWRCISPEGGLAEAFVTPSRNFETFFRAMAELRFNPAEDMTNPERVGKFMGLTASHGIQMLPPAIK